MRFAGREDFPERGHKSRLGSIIRPERKDSAGMKFRSEFFQTLAAVKIPVPFMQQIRRGMINIEKDGVEATLGNVRIKSRLPRIRYGELEKIAMHKTAAGIRNESLPQRNEPLLMPLDDRFEIVDHQK